MVMQNEPFEVAAVVVPEEVPQMTLPKTVLVRIYEDEGFPMLESAVQAFVEAEKPERLFRTIPVGSSEDFIEYWIEYPCDATEAAERLRNKLSQIYHRSHRR